MALNTETQYLNIAGEIINLSELAKEANAGRTATKQFHRAFTDIDSEIDVLKKVFGIPTLRHTPSIMKESGCSLTESEAAIVQRILEKRVADLNRGLKLSSGLAFHSTQQKVRNYEIVLRRLKELIGAPISACEPERLRTIDLKMPTIPETATKELLLLVLMLLTGLANGDIRRNNISQRLGSITLQEIANKLQHRNPSVRNVKGYLRVALDLPEKFSTLIIEHTNVVERLETAQEQFDKASAQVRGKNDALQALYKLIEEEQRKIVDLAGRNDPKAEEEKELKTVLEAKVGHLTDERVEAAEKLQSLTEEIATLKDIAKRLVADFETTKDKMREEYQRKVVDLEATIKQKEEIQDQYSEQEKVLISQKKDITALQDDKEALQREISGLKEQIEIVKRKEEDVIRQVLGAVEQLNGDKTTGQAQATQATQESIHARLTVLEAVLDAFPHRTDIKTQVEKLRASLLDEETQEPQETQSPQESKQTQELEFSETLKRLLLQSALLDTDDPEAILTDDIVEPVKEKLCLLLVFVELFNKQLDKYVAESIVQYKEKHPSSSPDVLKQLDAVPKFVANIDRIYIGEIPDEMLWKTISTVGQIIDGLAYSGLLPSDSDSIFNKLAALDKKISISPLYDLVKLAIRFLPDAEKIVRNKKVVPKVIGTKSYSELPFFYLLQMRLLSRYTDYILNKAPNKLECPTLGLAIE